MTRRVSLTGISTDAPGRSAETKYYSRAANEIPLPSGSISTAPIPPLQPLNIAKTRFNEAIVLALLFNCLLWFGFALVLQALFF